MLFDNFTENKKKVVQIVFEAGPTHDGLQTAKALVDIAANAGADAIKFQIIDAKKIVRDAYEKLYHDAEKAGFDITDQAEKLEKLYRDG